MKRGDADQISNPFYHQSADLLHDDVFTLAGFTMCGPGLGKAVRERFVALAGGLLRKYGPRAFEMPKRAAAIHEAGHVVINSVLGVRTTNVLIDPISRDGKLFWIGYTDAPDLAFLDSPASPVSFDHILRRSRATYAGLAAEMLFAGEDRREGSSLDESTMSQLLAERAASLLGVDAEILWRDNVANWCAIQLHRNRQIHADITDALMSRRRLKGKVLREFCASALAAAEDEKWPDIQDHTSQLFDAGIITDDAEVWA
ncbi:hypothetical protein [Bradyrhizobium erythrophlei]|uniref:Peptidase family M41 n=1 Tax=Bradyrhizobium erythrophlei TaxID=1437360 RepID=A0A1M7T779_9BRAD|nr:hypothetical protein [Bradyrhizobium erythrophlei]SHN66586.1 hypothetical protein SAMN05444170_1001 [Bradyrhizobium erythrophlei]